METHSDYLRSKGSTSVMLAPHPSFRSAYKAQCTTAALYGHFPICPAISNQCVANINNLKIVEFTEHCL